MNLNEALEAHADWRYRFHDAIVNRRPVDVATIARDDLCVLGRWLHGEAKSRYSTLKSYAACHAEHAHFHREAAKVADASNAGRYQEAVAMLSAPSNYAAAWITASFAIKAFMTEAGL